MKEQQRIKGTLMSPWIDKQSHLKQYIDQRDKMFL